MKDLAEAALNAAQVKGASYADVRLDEHVTQDIIVKNGQLAAVSDDASEGFGVRVIVDGAWGFAGSARLDKTEIEPVVDRAIRIARASARVRSARLDLGPPVTSRGRYRTPLERDPFAVPLSEKVDLLLRADAAMGSVQGVTIRDASQPALQIHESCGHPTELDRVFGMEAAYAGTSFMTPEKLNHLQYGSPKVTITADALTPTGLGTFGWDDEGVPTQRSYLIKNGLFVGYLTSRETGSVLGG